MNTLNTHIIRDIAPAIAQALGGSIKPKHPSDEYGGYAYVPRDEAVIMLPENVVPGGSFSIEWDYIGRGQRLVVRGEWPRKNGITCATPRLYGLGDSPKITLSPERSIAALVGDIQRRFLPAYVPLYQELVKRVEIEQRNENAQRAAAEKLYQLLGVNPCLNCFQERIRQGDVYCNAQSVYFQANVRPGGETVRIEGMQLPIEIANQLATLIREYKPTTP
jgi:hypothetical protein